MSKTLDPADKLDRRMMVPVTEAMLQEIKDYRFDRRIGSQSDAVRRLIAAGLEAERERAAK